MWQARRAADSGCRRDIVFIEHVGYALNLVEPHPKFTGVGAVDQKPGLQLGMKRVVGEGDDVLELLPRVLLGLVHQRDLTADTLAKLV